MNNINTSENINYLFGEQLFIGFIKFYAEPKGFGYLASNNRGMNSQGEFRKRFLDFYIDKLSFDEKVVFNQLVVFRPAYVNNKLKAINVRQYRKDTHSQIAIDYIFYDNTIHWDKKIRKTIPGGLSDISYDISIFSLAGIHRYELINKCTTIYKEKGEKAFLDAIDNCVSLIGGEKEFYWKLNKEYEYNKKEHNAIENMFDTVDSLIAQKIVLKHPSLQFLAPKNILFSLIGKLNDDYLIPKEVKAEHRTKKLQNIIKDNKVFQCFYDEEKKTYIRRGSIETKEGKNRFLLLLKYCPEDIKDSLKEEVVRQITEGIQTFILDIEHKTRLEKKHLLRYCVDYIDERQKEIIEKSFKDNDIKEYVEEVNGHLELISYKHNFESFAKYETENYYRIKPEIQSAVKRDLVEALSHCLRSTLEYINKEWSVDLYRYKTIDSIIKTNKFISKECLEEFRKILKHYLIDVCEKEIFKKKYNNGLVRNLKEILEKEEYESTLALYYSTVLEKGSLDVICQFFINFEYSVIPINLNELVASKPIEEIAECGDTFFELPEKSSSLFEKIILKIRDSYDSQGDFLQYYPLSYNEWDFLRNEKQEEGLNRYHFLVKVFSNMTPEKSSCFVKMLSCHDRIILSLSRKSNFSYITQDDVISELLHLGVNEVMDVILQEISFSCQAIIEIITSTPCKYEEDLQEKFLWLRKYYSINKRKYSSIEQRNYYETKLLDYFIDLSHKFNIDLQYYGIDVDNHLLPLSYEDLACSQSFLKHLYNTIVENRESCFKIRLQNCFDGNNGINEIIGKIFDMHYSIQDNQPYLIMDKETNVYNSRTIKAYIALNVLNNLHLLLVDKGKSSPIVLFSNQEMISYVTSIFNLKYYKGSEERTRFKWDEGDVDYTVSWEYINVEFEKGINKDVVSILEDAEPKLQIGTRGLAYNYGHNEYLDNSESAIKMTLKLFEAYKEGLLHC